MTESDSAADDSEEGEHSDAELSDSTEALEGRKQLIQRKPVKAITPAPPRVILTKPLKAKRQNRFKGHPKVSPKN